MKVLHIGCGMSKLSGAIGLDLRPYPGVDIVHDLEISPLPFQDNAFDLIVAKDVLEHVRNLVPLMEEIHRICKNDACVQIQVPYISGLSFAHDPTHLRGFTTHSFDYFIRGTPYFEKYRYSKAVYDRVSMRLTYWSNRTLLYRVGGFIANRRTSSYEKFLRFFVPMDDISVVLKAIK